MTQETQSTIQELAEVIADQNCELRELRETADEQSGIIADLELDQENAENIDAALYEELKEIKENSDSEHAALLADVLDRYFVDFE